MTIPCLCERAGGWQTAPRKLRKTKEEPVTEFDSVAHPGEGRTRLGAVQEGQVFQGMVTKLMLYHGAQVGHLSKSKCFLFLLLVGR